MKALLFGSLMLVAGCGAQLSVDSGTPDAGATDSGTPDGGSPDSGTPDGGSPDGGSMAVSVDTFFGQLVYDASDGRESDLFLFPFDGGPSRRLTGLAGAFSVHPRISPSGTQIAFAPDGSSLELVVDDGLNASSPDVRKAP